MSKLAFYMILLEGHIYILDKKYSSQSLQSNNVRKQIYFTFTIIYGISKNRKKYNLIPMAIYTYCIAFFCDILSEILQFYNLY